MATIIDASLTPMSFRNCNNDDRVRSHQRCRRQKVNRFVNRGGLQPFYNARCFPSIRHSPRFIRLPVVQYFDTFDDEYYNPEFTMLDDREQDMFIMQDDHHRGRYDDIFGIINLLEGLQSSDQMSKLESICDSDHICDKDPFINVFSYNRTQNSIHIKALNPSHNQVSKAIEMLRVLGLDQIVIKSIYKIHSDIAKIRRRQANIEKQ